MRRIISVGLALSLAVAAVIAVLGGEADSGFSPYVDAEGNISIPENYRHWAFLGS